MADQQMTENDLHALSTAQHQVVLSLMDEGRFPEGWVDAYCTFLAETLAREKSSMYWPCRLFQAVHFVSCHLHFRYRVWRASKGTPNPETERQLGQAQLESELFLWNSAFGVRPFLDAVTLSGEQEVDDRDEKLVELCFEDNAVLRSGGGVDDSAIEAWRREYRTTLSAIRVKWQLRPHVWKWLALAVRFASF